MKERKKERKKERNKKERKEDRSFIFSTQHILHIILWGNYLMKKDNSASKFNPQ
jgi:hypothetical protein